MKHGWKALLVALLSSGCGELDEEGFQTRYIREICTFYENCTKLYFVEYYDDQAECVEELEDNYDDYDYYDDCDFDPDEADKCLDSLKLFARSCDYSDYDDACGDVWDCGGGRRQTDTSSYYYSYYSSY